MFFLISKAVLTKKTKGCSGFARDCREHAGLVVTMVTLAVVAAVTVVVLL